MKAFPIKIKFSRIGFLWILFLLMFFLSISETSYAEARFMGIEELIAVSDAIAVIDVKKSEKLGEIYDKNIPEINGWRYAQKNYFKFLKLIKFKSWEKPDLNKIYILWAEKSFECARASYKKGLYLVFLEYVGKGEWVTINHQYGGLRTGDNNIVYNFEYYLRNDTSNNGDKMKKYSLKEAEREIEKRIIKKGKTEFYGIIVSKPDYYKKNNKESKESIYRKIKIRIKENVEINGKIVKKGISGIWPRGLQYMVKAYIKNGEYSNIINNKNTFLFEGFWKDGYLFIKIVKKADG